MSVHSFWSKIDGTTSKERFFEHFSSDWAASRNVKNSFQINFNYIYKTHFMRRVSVASIYLFLVENWEFAHFLCDEKMKFGGHFCIQNVFLNFLVNNNLLINV